MFRPTIFKVETAELRNGFCYFTFSGEITLFVSFEVFFSEKFFSHFRRLAFASENNIVLFTLANAKQPTV